MLRAAGHGPGARLRAEMVTVVAGKRKLYEGVPAGQAGLPAGKLTVKLRDAPDYHRRGGEPLWKQLVEIRKAPRR